MRDRGSLETPNSNTNVVFIGPSASGKTAALCLLHYTVMDYQNSGKYNLGVDRYIPNIMTKGYDFFRDANSLVMFGNEIEPTAPSMKDLKIELQFHFRGLLRGKDINLVFADMAGPISTALMKVFPDLTSNTPEEVEAELQSYSITSEDAKYLVKHILDADGLILVADASKIGKRGPDNPDGPLAAYLNNLLKYIDKAGKTPKGVALLLTKFDKWYSTFGTNNPDKDKIEKFVKNRLPTVWALISALNKTKGVQFKIFYSGLQESGAKPEEIAEDGSAPSKFLVAEDCQQNQRVIYNIEQYVQLIHWIKEVFQ